MATVDVRIPQLGEGLQEARIVRFLKAPGEMVARDEPIYEMETDKAVMEIESPAEGRLVEWTAREDEVLPIGAVIGRIDSAAHLIEPQPLPPFQPEAEPARATPQKSAVHPIETVAELRNDLLPPKTRARARELGISNEQLAAHAARVGRKLMPADLEDLRAQTTIERAMAASEGYTDMAMPVRQRTLIHRLHSGQSGVIQATLEMPLEWSAIERARGSIKEAGGELQPSQFILFAWCVAQASAEHPQFRRAMNGEAGIREYFHLNLGIAVARPGDELMMARIDSADTLGLADFVTEAQRNIQAVRSGADQASQLMQVSLTNMGTTGARFGIPVVAAPAVATLFVGTPYHEAYPLETGGVGFRKTAHLVMTFDHRLANGIGAAAFLVDIKARVEAIDSQIGPLLGQSE